MSTDSTKLAIDGGTPAVTLDQTAAFHWPNLGSEEEEAVLAVLRRNRTSIGDRSDVIAELEDRFAEYLGTRFTLARNNGTAALYCAYFAVGIGYGDEVIVPSYTWIATVSPLLQLGAVPVFADIDPQTLTLDPGDVERKITGRTKAIVPVHMWGHPADMDRINEIAARRNLRVVEDASHAHGSLYKGRKVGTLADAACFSLQASKSMTAGEGGLLATDSRACYERAMVLGQSPARLHAELTDPALRRFANTGMGLKFRIHGLAAAIAVEQLKKLDAFNATRNANHDRLTAALQALPGLTPPYTAPGCYRGAFYEYRLVYDPEAHNGLPTAQFIRLLQAEGMYADRERYPLVHLEPLYSDQVLFDEGLPWMPKHERRAVWNRPGDLPVTERLHDRLVRLPPFPNSGSEELIDQYAAAIRKVVLARAAAVAR